MKILILGGRTGLGKALAEEFADHEVLKTSRNGHHTRMDSKPGFIGLNLNNLMQVTNFVNTAPEVDVVIGVAHQWDKEREDSDFMMTGMNGAPIMEQNLWKLNDRFTANVTAYMAIYREYVKRGTPIVHISSIAADMDHKDNRVSCAYRIYKLAQVQVCKSLTEEAGGKILVLDPGVWGLQDQVAKIKAKEIAEYTFQHHQKSVQ
jgi:NAD(P)-dependent dehydrogenase (short-subunit alcohol dehydrogenase family)